MADKFTKEQIRAAFYKVFHQSGEIFFPYWEGEEESNAESTESWWREIEEELNKSN